MKDIIIDYITDHEYENEDGSWQRMDSTGEPVGSKFYNYEDFINYMWTWAMENIETVVGYELG